MHSDDRAEPDVLAVRCHRCHERRACLLLPDPVAVDADPDMADELTHRWWCRECYRRRQDARRPWKPAEARV